MDGRPWVDQRHSAGSACIVDMHCALQAAFDIFATMRPRGIQPTLLTFHTLLKGTSYLQAAGLLDLYAQMLHTEGLVPTDVTFHYVFRAASRCSIGLPASWLFQVLP